MIGVRVMRRFVRAAAILAAWSAAAAVEAQDIRTAVFAGGCFWCLEAAFEHMPGVLHAETGYAGGATSNPTFAAVTEQRTDHRTAVRVTYDLRETTYARLLRGFWINVDPFDREGQFCERGPSYAPAIFVDGPEARAAAEDSRRRVGEALGAPVSIDILARTSFWMAEAGNQDYWRKFPARFDFYVRSCGRATRLEQVWSVPPGVTPHGGFGARLD
jgi:peptide-methionine (S)-S-oxide reductase